MISSFVISAFRKDDVTADRKLFLVCPENVEEEDFTYLSLSSRDATVFNDPMGISEPVRVKKIAEKKFPDHKFKIHGLDFDYKGD